MTLCVPLSSSLLSQAVQSPFLAPCTMVLHQKEVECTVQALGALPYIVVLDHATKSVVVSVRGSVSTADWVTDFLGIPEVLDEWLSDAFKEVTFVQRV